MRCSGCIATCPHTDASSSEGVVASRCRCGPRPSGASACSGSARSGRRCSTQLVGFGFDCAGWSRSRHAVDGVPCHAGADELDAFLARTDILVCLLPLTDATRGFLNAELLREAAARRRTGARRTRRRSWSTPTCSPRSTPASSAMPCSTSPSPSRCRPGIRSGAIRAIQLTPHIASMTQPASAAKVVLDNLRRYARGEPLIGLVDRARGY